MNQGKMSGKQKVVGGFDLDQFVSGADRPEKKPASVQKSTAEKKKPATGASATKLAEKPSRAVQKPEKELLTERVQVKLTRAEMSALQGKIGMAPVSVYVRKFLKDNGLI